MPLIIIEIIIRLFKNRGRNGIMITKYQHCICRMRIGLNGANRELADRMPEQSAD